MNKEIMETLEKEKPHFYMADLKNYNNDFLIDIIEWQYQMIEALTENTSSTKKGCGKGKKMDALGYIICGEFDDLKHGGKQWLCNDCKSTKEVINSPQRELGTKALEIAGNDSEIPKASEDIHSQNKELLDKDYIKEPEDYSYLRDDANTTNQVGGETK